jgi:O-antigen/teichoic acid export membrane protein
MENKSRLGKNIIIFGLGTSVSKLMSILLVGLYTAYLTAEDFGYYDILFTIVSMTVPLITIQITDALYRNLLDSRGEGDTARAITASFAVAVCGLGLAVGIMCIVNLLADIRMGWLLPGYVVTAALLIFSQQAARGLKRNTVFAASGLIYTGVMVGCNIYFIVVLGLGVEALIYSAIIADICAAALIEAAVGVYRRVRLSALDTLLVKSMCRYSIPLLPNAMMWWLLMLINRAVISGVLGTEYNGIFAVSSKFPALLMTVFNIFGWAWQESAITEYNSAGRDEYYSKTFNLYMRLLFASLLLLLPITRYLTLLLIGEAFSEAWKYIPCLYIGSLFAAFSQFYGTGYLSAKKTRGAFVTTLIGVSVGFAALFLMPAIGLHAAALAQMAAYIAVFLARVIHTRRFFRIRAEWGVMAAMIALVVLYLLGYYYDTLRLDIAMLSAAAVIFPLINRELFKRVINALKAFRQRGADGPSAGGGTSV